MTRLVYMHASGHYFIQFNPTLLTTTDSKIFVKRNVSSDRNR